MSTHKEYALIAILATAAIVGVGPAFGYCPPDCTPKTNYTAGLMTGNNVTTVQPIVIPVSLPLSLTTDKTTYDRQSVVDVTGHVQNVIPGLPVTLRVSDSLGNIVEVSQLTVDNKGNFETKFDTSSPLWSRGGTYTIYAQYGVQQGLRMAQTQITIGTVIAGAASCQPNQLAAKVDGQQYCIGYSITGGTATGATISTISKELTVNIQSTQSGQITLTIPRTVLDAKAGVKDDSFFVLANGQEQDSFTDTPSANARTLTIPFTAGTEQIGIIGTQVVPEFGPIAALVFAIAIVSIIAVSAKTGLRLLPKY
ncbi:MAG: PEFG-CTERM sorting domain-containing protein [Thaumarchaeota archaeon]|nr:PEFG-CTERM sorting domain-containing protein [Nitrososphaerota archaeon]